MQHSVLSEVKYSLQLASIRAQFSRIWPVIIIGLVVALLATATIALLNIFFDIPVSYLTRDAAATTRSSFYIGFLSSLGIMAWSASAGICFLGASLLRHNPARSQSFRFLLFSGLLYLMLVLDDAFLLHEEALPKYLNIPEKAALALYPLVTTLYLLYFWQHILTTDYLLLAGAFLFLGLSLLIDIPAPPGGVWLLMEDGLKFFGIVFWLGYFAHTAYMALQSRPQALGNL